MEFDFGKFAIVLPPLHITIIAIIITFFLVRWGKQLETRRFTVFFYFLISTMITPIFSISTRDFVFQLWFPLGFIVILLYLFSREKIHPAKMKASILGLSIAIYQIIFHMLDRF